MFQSLVFFWENVAMAIIQPHIGHFTLGLDQKLKVYSFEESFHPLRRYIYQNYHNDII